jgi:L-alanine-DL-glutamate epimerase-like enolase superfamily enzyme
MGGGVKDGSAILCSSSPRSPTGYGSSTWACSTTWVDPPAITNGMITAPARPGHGFAFKPEVLKEFRIAG